MDSQVLKSVWFIETISLNEEVNSTSIGGGICIHPSGLILTVAHVVVAGEFPANECKILARSYNDQDLYHRTVKLIDVFPHFDLALFKVSKSEEEELDFLPLKESVQVGIGDRVYAYIHQNMLLFSGMSGIVSYPFPENVDLPDMTEKTTMESSGYLEHNPTHFQDQRCRTIASVTQKSDVAFYDMHPNLPLVQVTGFGTQPGASGCPVFKYGSGELIGLFTIQKLSYHFIIPVNFLKVFVDHIREVHGY